MGYLPVEVQEPLFGIGSVSGVARVCELHIPKTVGAGEGSEGHPRQNHPGMSRRIKSTWVKTLQYMTV